MNERVCEPSPEDRERLAAQGLPDEGGDGAAVGEPHARPVSIVAAHPDPAHEVLRLGHREVVHVRSGQALLDRRNPGPYEVALAPGVQGLSGPTVPVQDVEVRNLAHRQPIEWEAALAVLAGEGCLVSTKRGDDPKAQENQREILRPPLAHGIEAHLVPQLLPAVCPVPFPIPLQEPLEAGEGELEDPRRDAGPQEVEDLIEQKDEQARVRVEGRSAAHCRRLFNDVHAELATQDCRGMIQIPLVGAE